MSKVHKWVYDNAILTILVVVWGLALVTWVTYKMFEDPTSITMAATSAYATLFSIPAMVVGLWKWRNGGDKP